MLVGGLALIAAAIGLLWVCLPTKGGETKPFLRKQIVGVVVAVTMTGCLGIGIILIIAGITRY